MEETDKKDESKSSSGMSLKEQVTDFFSGPPRPWFQAFFPLISLLLITLAVYFSIDRGREAAQDKLSAIVQQALKQNDLSRIEDLLNKMVLVKGLRQEHLLKNYNYLIEIVTDLRQNRMEAAVKKISALNPSYFRGLISQDPEVVKVFNRVQEDFNTLQTSFTKYQSDRKVAPRRLEQLLKQLNRLTIQSNNIAFETAALFSLAPQRPGRVVYDERRSKIVIEKTHIYTMGVLKGVPMLRGLPNNIKNRVELRETLEKIGGKINLSGDNLAVEFDLRIKKLASDTLSTRNQIMRLEQEYMAVDNFQVAEEFQLPEVVSRLTNDVTLLIVKSLQK